MSRDIRVYQDPEIFNPDRFLPKEEGGVGEPYLVGPFGFGRRYAFCLPWNRIA
jgi:cytochrome P450